MILLTVSDFVHFGSELNHLIIDLSVSKYMKNILVTFDIDSTLLKTLQSSPHNRALQHALKEMFGVDERPAVYLNVSFSGCSDEWIVNELIKKATNSQTAEKKLRDKFVEISEKIFPDLLKQEDLIILPGIENLLENLRSHSNVTTAVCSGNLTNIGWMKIERSGLGKYFPEKASGWGEFEDRADILRAGIKSAEEKTGKKFDKIIHIGDAPQDVKAAHDVNAKAVAVKTGRYKDDDFEQPCLIVDNAEIGYQKIVDFIFSE
ncbi:haloacid dehalogenase-like hydrolase family protein [Tritrichomonas foetus]|uniref:Haloacid dehalogenase-like hydrolase family protein n=1 Tax=Tritrichomonas foetus TaxID=1144522 RepID=A0A1J4K5G9_9EUKA|nr:haloacid dehalogenase-like hydrolase family protein [Tritrichomonas foetus]|eukprot:OHT06120.1 haloacid dehalogenase-like hydrolase family protein [Tritrichomonas foetus]